eukprot:2449287-Pyramimonas_sp.AAC.1
MQSGATECLRDGYRCRFAVSACHAELLHLWCCPSESRVSCINALFSQFGRPEGALLSAAVTPP